MVPLPGLEVLGIFLSLVVEVDEVIIEQVKWYGS